MPRREWCRSLALATLAGCLVVGVVGGGSGVHAQPLPPEQCRTIADEHEALVKAGVPETLKKGPAWAKANLAVDKIKDVERYIGLEEQLLFHCGLAAARKLPGAGAEEEGDTTQAEAAAVPPPPPVRKPPRKAKPKSDTAAAEATPPPPRPKPKAAAKAKVEDAYRPPPKAAEPAAASEQ